MRGWGTGVFLIGCWVAAPCGATSPQESRAFVAASTDYVELAASDTVRIDLRYATANNFVGADIYGAFNHPYLHRTAAEKLTTAAAALAMVKPGYKLVIFDALRPRSVQWLLWQKVSGTEQQIYVANPRTGSIHNYGLAVDLSLLDDHERELDMGTPYDDFTPLAQPRREEQFLREGKLTQTQLDNRRLLRKVMEQAGFIQLPLEWWHFDALPRSEVKKDFSIVE